MTETYEFVGGPLDGMVRDFCFSEGTKTVAFPSCRNFGYASEGADFGRYYYRIDGKFLRFGSVEKEVCP